MSSKINYKSFYENLISDSQYWGSEAAGCIFIAKDTGRILLSYRTAPSTEPNTWAGWGGKIDGNETPAQAVEREIEEETGFNGDYKITPIYTYEDPNNDFKYYNYVVIVPYEFTPQLNWEHSKSQWVEYGEWPTPLHFGIQALLNVAGNKIYKIISLLKQKQQKQQKNISEATVMDVPPQKPAIVQSAFQISDGFIKYLKIVENSKRDGYNSNKKLWFPHKSPEGGMETIAYGHKIKNTAELNRFSRGLTESQAIRLLKNDIEDAWIIVQKELKSITGGVDIPLDIEQKEMLIDFAFNMGTIKKFPKFVKGLLNKDWNTVKREYKRKFKDKDGNVYEVSDRNRMFYNRYLANK